VPQTAEFSFIRIIILLFIWITGLWNQGNVSVKLNVYSFYSMAISAAISYQGLSFFFPNKIFCEKQNTRPKRKPMHDTLTLQWFSFSRNDLFVFFWSRNAFQAEMLS